MRKCPSCKYERRTFTEYRDTVVRYKSGKNQGEIKEVNRERVIYFKDDPEFNEIVFEHGGDAQLIDNNGSSIFGNKENVDLLVCPECGTVFVGHW